MARREITNRHLLLIENDLLQVRDNMPGIAMLLDLKLHTFFRQNAMPLRVLHSRMHDIQKKFIVHDAEDKPLYAPEEEGKQKDWQYLDSVTLKNGLVPIGPEVKEAYQQEFNEIINRSITIEI